MDLFTWRIKQAVTLLPEKWKGVKACSLCGLHLSQTSGATVVQATRLRHRTLGSAKNFLTNDTVGQGCWSESVDRCAHSVNIFVDAM
jgi:hypothetical protein